MNLSPRLIKTTATASRRPDLDALRAAAMLLGIAYHTALSFGAGLQWIVRDNSQSQGMFLFQAAVHGFRMQLFFLISGYFTAMLMRAQGLNTLLQNRMRRILLPCLLGLITIVPAFNLVVGVANRTRANQRLESIVTRQATPGFWAGLGTSRFHESISWLIHTPVFVLVWFLWFLCWFLFAFAVYEVVSRRFGWNVGSYLNRLSSRSLIWLIPLTMIPARYMTFSRWDFGPDTSEGILPMPHVLAYYALFFAFGVLYYDFPNLAGRAERSWRWLLPIALFIVFPIGLEFATGTFGIRDLLLPARLHHPASVAFQALYAWMMIFGTLGMFRSLFTRENSTIRYISDSSFWLYLTHLPLIIAAQILVRHWPIPAVVKATTISLVVTGFLLLAYEAVVRYTWLGTLLNGPRTRSHTDRPAALQTFPPSIHTPVREPAVPRLNH